MEGPENQRDQYEVRGSVMTNIFKQLCEGGGYTLPYLLHLYTEDEKTNIYLVNDNKDCVYESVTFYASNFTYTPNDDGESSLEVELVDKGSDIIDILDVQYSFRAEIIGALREDGTVSVNKAYRHHYGSATWDGKGAKITFDKDDRFGMTFPALIFNSYNNRGNS